MKPNALRNQKDVNKYFIQVFSVCAILAYFPWHLGEKCSYLLLTIISPRSYIIHEAILRGAWIHSSLSQPHYGTAWKSISPLSKHRNMPHGLSDLDSHNIQARAHTKTHYLDICACRSQWRILTRSGAVRTHGGRCQQRRRAERSLPECGACLVCITWTDRWRSAQSRAGTPQSGSVMLEPSLWGGEGCRGGERRRHRPTWILASSHSRTVCLQPFWIQMWWIPPRRHKSTRFLASTHDESLLLRDDNVCTEHHRISEETLFVLLLLLRLSLPNSQLYRSISVFLWCSPIFPLHCSLSLSLILSCVSVLCSACAQRMSNMCWGWGLGTADFIGGTLTSHTDRFAEDGTACAHILCTAAVDFDKICLAPFSCQRS